MGRTSNLKEEVDFDTFQKEIIQNRKCDPLFYAGERKINIIHAHMRMTCSNLNTGSDLNDLHVKDNPSCLYCNQIEDANNFYFSCPTYTVER